MEKQFSLRSLTIEVKTGFNIIAYKPVYRLPAYTFQSWITVGGLDVHEILKT